MNYQWHYDALISKAKERGTTGNIYKELHHIVPRCMGGLDEDSNLVSLHPEEHYLAHLLLAKIYPDVSGLWYACGMMCSIKEGRSNNKTYGWVRRKISEKMKLSVLNKWAIKYGFDDYIDQTNVLWDRYVVKLHKSKDIRSDYGMSLTNIRNSLYFYAENNNCVYLLEEADSKQKSAMFKEIRKNFTDEQESRRIAAVKNMDYEARAAKTGSRQGKNNPVYGKTWKHEQKQCPHCGKVVSTKRWHFDNCRSKIETKDQTD